LLSITSRDGRQKPSTARKEGHEEEAASLAVLSPPNEPDRARDSQQDDGAERQRPDGLRFVFPQGPAVGDRGERDQDIAASGS
jgi:hypothetical protein